MSIDKTINAINNKDTSISLQPINTETVTKALTGDQGIKIITDYSDKEIMSAYSLINFKDTKWAIIAELNKDEALSEAYENTYKHKKFML